MRWGRTALVLGGMFLTPAVLGGQVLKVCADPANLPLSNDKGEGYENKIAAAMAEDLGRTVEYTYFPQRIGFVRNTLRMKDDNTQQFKCDVIIGVPEGYELTATTQPYLHSTYSLLLAPKSDLAALKTAEELLQLPRDKLAKVKVGVFTRSPGNDWLLKNSLMDQAVVYTHQNGDIQESPAKTVERDMLAGNIDAAILWGPIAAMVAQNHAQEKWRAVPFTPQSAIKFDYSIAMGLRQGEAEWKKTLDGWIAGHGSKIEAILKAYQIPIVDSTGHVEM